MLISVSKQIIGPFMRGFGGEGSPPRANLASPAISCCRALAPFDGPLLPQSSPKQMRSCLCCHTGMEPSSFTELALLRQGRGWRFRTSLNELSSRKYLDRNVKEGPKVFPSRSILFHPRAVLHIRLFALWFGLFTSRFNG